MQMCIAGGRSAALLRNTPSATQRESVSARGGGSAIGKSGLLALASPGTSTMFCIDSAQPMLPSVAESLRGVVLAICLALDSARAPAPARHKAHGDGGSPCAY